MKTLYVSDLDGTLMQPDARISPRAVAMLNEAIASGKLFTVATARTPATVSGILKDIDMRLPAVVMTGAALWDIHTGNYSDVCYIDSGLSEELMRTYISTDTPIFVFELQNNILDIFQVGGCLTPQQRVFMEERIDSPFKRFHVNEDGRCTFPSDSGKVVLFYTMLPDAKARRMYEVTKKFPGVRSQYYHDIYGPEIGILENLSDKATKARAIRTLADRLGADRIVCFGDNINDLPMMAEADIAVAVENALPEVKAAADVIIGPNTSDSVARFILDHD